MTTLKWLAFVALLISQVDVSYAQSRGVIVNVDQFRCLTKKIKKVPVESKGVYVEIRDCRTKGLKIIRSLVPPKAPNDDGTESLIFLKPHHIRCIKQNRSSIDRVAKDMGNGRARLRLDPCGK